MRFQSLIYFSKFCSGTINGGDKRSQEVDKEVKPTSLELQAQVKEYQQLIVDKSGDSPEELYYKISLNKIHLVYNYTTKEEKRLQVR